MTFYDYNIYHATCFCNTYYVKKFQRNTLPGDIEDFLAIYTVIVEFVAYSIWPSLQNSYDHLARLLLVWILVGQEILIIVLVGRKGYQYLYILFLSIFKLRSFLSLFGTWKFQTFHLLSLLLCYLELKYKDVQRIP